MTTEISEIERAEKSANYAFRKYVTLQIEISLLLTEHSGLVDIARNIHDRKDKQIKPLMDRDLLYEDVYYKWSDQGFRYYAAAQGLIETMVEKATQLHENLTAFKTTLDEGNYKFGIDIDFETEIARWKKFEKDFKNKKADEIPALDFSEYIN